MATLWRGADGTWLVLATNFTDQPVTARFTLPATAELADGWKPADCATGRSAQVTAVRDGDDLVLEMAAASAAAVTLKQP